MATVTFGALFISGCLPDGGEIGDFFYDEVGGEYVVTDQFENSLSFDRDQAEQIAELGDAKATAYLTAKFRSEYPESYQDPDTQTQVSEEVDVPGEVQVSKTASSAADSLSYIPGVGPILSIVGNGVLGIGALWYRRKKKRAELVGESLVKGIDTFRDVLDQTPQGEKIDEELKERLKEHRDKLGVAKEMVALLERWATPTKKPINLDQ